LFKDSEVPIQTWKKRDILSDVKLSRVFSSFQAMKDFSPNYQVMNKSRSRICRHLFIVQAPY